MASRKQVAAAKRNIVKARRAARSKKTILHLPKAVRQDLSRQAAKWTSPGVSIKRSRRRRTSLDDLGEAGSRPTS